MADPVSLMAIAGLVFAGRTLSKKPGNNVVVAKKFWIYAIVCMTKVA